MSDTSEGPGWWLASDGRWYPPTASPGPAPWSGEATSTTLPFSGPPPRSGSNPVQRILSIAALVIIPLFALAFWLPTRTPSDQTAHTTGIVVSCVQSSSDGFESVARFTVGGHTYTAQQVSGTRTGCIHATGDRVTVNYDPSDPANSSIPASGPPTVFIVAIGVACLVILVASIRTLVRRRRS